MYQQVLRRFSKFNAIQLSEPAPLRDLLLMALRDEELETGGDETETNSDLKEKIAQVVALTLPPSVPHPLSAICICVAWKKKYFSVPWNFGILCFG